jgi:predicted RNA-binding protein with PUA-like domain
MAERQDRMNYWLMKSEPSTWSWDDQRAKGDEGEGWDGVRNYQASNNMKAMDIGDLAFFYHSVNEKQIVGIVEVIELYHPDPTDASGRFGMVTVKAVRSMSRPVTLAEIKADERLAEMALVRQSRLSVTPVTTDQWAILMEMGDTAL